MVTSVYFPGRRVLHSWKEISTYTGRGVRTIQRYEVQFGFPVHRPAGSPRSAVLAFSDEIDQWLAGSPTRLVQIAIPARHTEHAARMHSVWLKAKLGTERAHSMTERLLATKALLDRMTESLEKGRARRAKLSTKLEVTQAVFLKQFIPPRVITSRHGLGF